MIQIVNPNANFDHQLVKSTKNASKERRDKINAEINILKSLLPLPNQTRQRLGQLQLMGLVCVYVRKATYFNKCFKHLLDEFTVSKYFKDYTYITKASSLPASESIVTHESSIPYRYLLQNALSGFLIVMTQNGKLLYISDNAAEYLGHSMEDLLIQGDSVYDIIDAQDHQAIRETLETPKSATDLHNERREFLCSIIVNKNTRRQMRFGDQKLVLVSGKFFEFIPLSSSETPVFIAHCSPVVMPETRECVAQGNSEVYTSMHSIDLKYVHLDRNGETHLGVNQKAISNKSFYEFVHPEHLAEVTKKHIALSSPNSTEKSAILLIRIQNAINPMQPYCWSHVVMQVKEPNESGQAPLIINTVQVLTNREARVLNQYKRLYNDYSMHAKMQYGLTFNNAAQLNSSASSSASENGSVNNGTTAGVEFKPNVSSPLQQLVLNSNNTQPAPTTHNGVKRSRSCSNSPNHQSTYPYQLPVKSRSLNSPDQLMINAANLPSPAASNISPDISSLTKVLNKGKYHLSSLNNNENSNSSTNLTSEVYLSTSQYCLSPSNQTHQTNNQSLQQQFNLNPIAPLNVNSDVGSLSQCVTTNGQTAFHTHNLLQQYSPQTGSLPTPTYSPFINTSTNLFTHSPQHSSSIIINTTPPATPPEIANHSLNSNSSSQNGLTLLNSANLSSLNGNNSTGVKTSSNKRSLNSSSMSSSLNSTSSSNSARHSPEPKRAYLGQNSSSFSHYNNGYAGFNHYTYNVSTTINNYNSQSNHLSPQSQSNLLNNNIKLEAQVNSHNNQQTQSVNQLANAANNTNLAQQQYSLHHNRWLPITANSFTDLTMSNYYNAAAQLNNQLNQAVAHSSTAHQLTGHHQLNQAITHQQSLPNSVSSIHNQAYHPSYHSYTNGHHLRTVAELS